MKNLTPMMILGSFAFCGMVQAEESCSLCEKNREYNASHPENNYHYYEDYLKDEKEGKARKAHQNDEKAPATPAAPTTPEKK